MTREGEPSEPVQARALPQPLPSPGCSECGSPQESVGGFPGGSIAKNPLANAGDRGSIPDLGGSYVPWSILSPFTTMTGPVLWSPHVTTTEALLP